MKLIVLINGLQLRKMAEVGWEVNVFKFHHLKDSGWMCITTEASLGLRNRVKYEISFML